MVASDPSPITVNSIHQTSKPIYMKYLHLSISNGQQPLTMVDGLIQLETPVLDGKALSIQGTYSASAMTITRGQHKP